jgi:hypothetical protein
MCGQGKLRKEYLRLGLMFAMVSKFNRLVIQLARFCLSFERIFSVLNIWKIS